MKHQDSKRNGKIVLLNLTYNSFFLKGNDGQGVIVCCQFISKPFTFIRIVMPFIRDDIRVFNQLTESWFHWQLFRKLFRFQAKKPNHLTLLAFQMGYNLVCSSVIS